MKKNIFAILLLLVAFISANSQEIKIEGKENIFQVPEYANDKIIVNNPAIDQRNVKIACAYNGWLFAAFTQKNNSTNEGGIALYKSTDNGSSWTFLNNYISTDVEFMDLDLTVAGNTESEIKVYLTGIRHNISANNYVAYIDVYNGQTGNFIGNTFSTGLVSRKIYDVAIATDYKFPAYNANPYSVALIYSIYSSSKDSIKYVLSVDGGQTFTISNTVATTGYFFRNVSLSYGRSQSGSNGRYFAAWDRYPSSVSTLGNIFTSRNSSFITDNWIQPICLDSLEGSVTNNCNEPSICVEIGDNLNDSSGTTAIVLFNRAYQGNTNDYDVIGYYNKVAHYSNYWNRLNINNNSPNNSKNPNISFDPYYSNFLITYLDSSSLTLPYIVNNLNLTAGWVQITAQYNDIQNVNNAHPQVVINPIYNQVVHVWSGEGAGSNGVAYFDAEYSVAEISENIQNSDIVALYPNPASELVNFQFNEIDNEIEINIYDVAGKIFVQKNIENSKFGASYESFDVSEWQNGIYLVTIKKDNKIYNTKFVVNH